MTDRAKSIRKLALATNLLQFWMMGCLAAMGCCTVHIFDSFQRGQASHAQSFVQAKRIDARFEADVLNARISFIYFVTIQKPTSLQLGWESYHSAEAAVKDLSVLIGREPELKAMAPAEVKLQADMNSYSATLAQVLSMVQSGEHKGQHYDAMVKTWAAKGAVMLADGVELDELCFQSSQVASAHMADTMRSGRNDVEAVLFAGLLSSLALIIAIQVRSRRLVWGL